LSKIFIREKAAQAKFFCCFETLFFVWILTLKKKKGNSMLGNFSYANATKLYFGADSLKYLKGELEKYGKTVMLVYGGGSIKKNGIYARFIDSRKEAVSWKL